MYLITKKILFNLLICSGPILAQTEINYSNNELEKLINIFKITESEKQVNVYKFQLAFNEDRNIIENLQNKFENIFPNDSIDKIHEAPYFKLITGSYLNKQEAEIQLQRIYKEFPSAFIFQERVSINDI